jgi:predicted dehydrogenase
MTVMKTIRFAAIGLNHRHIYGQVDVLLKAGAELVTFCAPEEALAAAFLYRYPQARRVSDQQEILDDKTIDLVVSAAIPDERAPLGIAAMRAGKDYMCDKPGMVSLAQLQEVRRVQAETGRIYSVLYSEHYLSRSTVQAGALVKAGAIGEVLHVTGLGPHRLNAPEREGWFFERARYGGILADLASHQAEQFLFFTGATDAEVASAHVANLAHAAMPGLQDFGDMLLRTPRASGYVRVDWFTPDGLPSWGDGRILLMGTEGSIELRKQLDVAGAPGGDHLILVDGAGVRRVDCSATAITYGHDLLHDIRERTETAMPQAHCFKATELALRAQALAEGQA